jgi:hypothetical protein
MSLSLKASAINDPHYNYALDQLILITSVQFNSLKEWYL